MVVLDQLTTCSSSMGLDGSSFAVEGVVSGSSQLGASGRELLGGAGEASLEGCSEGRSSQLLREAQSNTLEGHGRQDWIGSGEYKTRSLYTRVVVDVLKSDGCASHQRKLLFRLVLGNKVSPNQVAGNRIVCFVV